MKDLLLKYVKQRIKKDKEERMKAIIEREKWNRLFKF